MSFKLVFIKRYYYFLLNLFFFLFFSNVAHSAEYKYFEINGFKVVTFNGRLEKGEAKRLEAFLKSNPQAEYILMQSKGGYVKEAIRVGQVIRKYKLNTAVETYCNSSCFIAFMAGYSRYVYRDAFVGIHRPFNSKQGVDIPDSKESRIYNSLVHYFSSIIGNKNISLKIVNLIYETPIHYMRKIDDSYPYITMNYYYPSAL